MRARRLLACLWYADIDAANHAFPHLSWSSGKRSDLRNSQKGGKPNSKHTMSGGDGLAADGWVNEARLRGEVMAWFGQRGWHVVAERHYDERQFHVQAYGYGVKPSDEAANELLSRRGVTCPHDAWEGAST